MNDYSFAIGMEREGEAYYREQAERTRDRGLAVVCRLLAEDEQNHARILTERRNGRPYDLPDTDTLAQAKSIFSGAGDIRLEWKERPSQLDFYRIASDLEQKSIDLYAGYLERAEDEPERGLLQYLVRQETAHRETLRELERLLARVEDWVESAEFGVREEY